MTSDQLPEWCEWMCVYHAEGSSEGGSSVCGRSGQRTSTHAQRTSRALQTCALLTLFEEEGFGRALSFMCLPSWVGRHTALTLTYKFLSYHSTWPRKAQSERPIMSSWDNLSTGFQKFEMARHRRLKRSIHMAHMGPVRH